LKLVDWILLFDCFLRDGVGGVCLRSFIGPLGEKDSVGWMHSFAPRPSTRGLYSRLARLYAGCLFWVPGDNLCSLVSFISWSNGDENIDTGRIREIDDAKECYVEIVYGINEDYLIIEACRSYFGIVLLSRNNFLDHTVAVLDSHQRGCMNRTYYGWP
jgi:hypothetical protein